jgi:hypothetical protein
MITDKMQKIVFGKYRNKTIYWVMQNDPDYLIWVYSNVGSFNLSDNILLETIKNCRNLKLK